jgi:hypothetical protein
MTTTNPAPVQAFIEYLEAEARTLSTTAGERRDLAEQLRKQFDLPSIATPAPAADPQRAPVAHIPAGGRAPRAAAARPIVPALDTFRTRILAELESGPKRSLQMKPKGLAARDYPLWVKALRTLQSDGAITVSGNRAGAKYTLASKKSAPVADTTKAPGVPGAWPPGAIYSAIYIAIKQSPDGSRDRRELLAAARQTLAACEFSDIDKAVKALHLSGHVQLKPSATGERIALTSRG